MNENEKWMNILDHYTPLIRELVLDTSSNMIIKTVHIEEPARGTILITALQDLLGGLIAKISEEEDDESFDEFLEKNKSVLSFYAKKNREGIGERKDG